MRSPNHSIPHLPPEILSEIFIRCLPRLHERPRQREAPINVSSVCKSWRQIATSTPQLWSKIAIRQDLHSPSESICMLKRWIDRSGGYGFSFTVCWTVFDNSPESENTAFNAIVDVLLDNCWKWRSIRLGLQESPLSKFLSVIPSRTPKIREIDLLCLESDCALPFTSIFDAPLNYLSHLSIIAHTKFSPCSRGFSLENLRCLCLTNMDQSYLIEFMSRSPCVEEIRASFDLNTQESQPIYDNYHVCLTHLRKLNVTLGVHTWHQGTSGPFDHFDLPALETFLLHVYRCSAPETSLIYQLWDRCIDLVCSFKNSLQNLEIYGEFSTSPPPFLFCLPKLKHLGISIGNLSNDFVHDLASCFPSAGNRLDKAYPCLESLYISTVPKDYRDHCEANLRAIVDHAIRGLEKSSTSVQPLIMVISGDLHKSFSLLPGCLVEIMGYDDWRNTPKHLDLYG